MWTKLPSPDYSENQKRLLQLIYSSQNMTRQDLVQLSSLSTLTVSRLITGFLSDGIVRESKTMESRGGRKPSVLEINPSYASIISIDIGAASVRIGMVSLNGKIADRLSFQYPSKVYPVAVLPPDELIQNIRNLLERHPEAKLTGMGFAISGLVSEKEGKVIFCPNISGYDNFAIKKFLEDEFQVPVFVSTSARCMALAEQRFGAGIGYAHQIFVSIGYSISAGIILNSAIFTGADGFSGEVGHLSASNRQEQCTCGNYDCLETHATLPTILSYMIERLKQPNVFSVVKSMLKNLDDLDRETINEALLKGDKVVYGVMDSIGIEIGDAITSLTNILNPEILILGGGVIESFPMLMESIARTVKKKALITNQQNLRILKSEMGFDCALIGGATQVINALIY